MLILVDFIFKESIKNFLVIKKFFLYIGNKPLVKLKNEVNF